MRLYLWTVSETQQWYRRPAVPAVVYNHTGGKKQISLKILKPNVHTNSCFSLNGSVFTSQPKLHIKDNVTFVVAQQTPS